MAKKIGRPKHLTEAIRERIQKDWVSDRDENFQLPTANQLAKTYGVNHRTIRRALADLENDKRIYSQPSGRAFVAGRNYQVWHPHCGKSIGFIFRSSTKWLNDPFQLEILKGAVDRLQYIGINMEVSVQNWRHPLPDQTPATQFQASHVMGVVVVGRHGDEALKALKGLEKPVISVDGNAVAYGIDSFCFDNVEAGLLLAKRLHKLGHKRIVSVFESNDKPSENMDEAWTERREGFVSYFPDQGLPGPQELFLLDRGIWTDTFVEIKRLLSQRPDKRPTAILLPGGFHRPIFEMAAALKLKIPRDLTLVGFGEKNSDKDLTAVRFDGRDMGRAAVLNLLKVIKTPGTRRRKTKLTRLKGTYRVGSTHARAPRTSG